MGKKEETEQLNREQDELLGKYKKQLANYYMEQKTIVTNQDTYKKDLRQRYKSEAEIRKYKYRMAQRHQNRVNIGVLGSLSDYCSHFLWLNTDDEVLFKYQRKLWTQMQWSIISGLAVGMGFSFTCLSLVRCLKKKSALDIPLYFGVPLAIWLHAKQRTN